MSLSRRTTVFRVRGLPAVELEHAKSSLTAIIDKQLSEEEKQTIKSQVTIVPSCDDNGETLTGLVDFKDGIPDFLSELASNPLGDLPVEIGDGADDISFDRHFHEFTQLYSTKDNAITAE
jgi:hypothetical protein